MVSMSGVATKEGKDSLLVGLKNLQHKKRAQAVYTCPPLSFLVSSGVNPDSTTVEKGYAHKVPPDELVGKPCWYLPHFPVIRADKQTTKVRIVFDSAAKCQAVCLNDAMFAGPKLQKDVLERLHRFRSKPVALVADIKEMFSQVILAEKDRPFQRFLWRDLDLSKSPEVYEAIRLTFGDRASPFLAQFVLRVHAEKNRNDFPAAAAVVQQKMYMDDVLHCEDTVDEAIVTRGEPTSLAQAGFQIRRWCNNKAELLKGIPKEDLATGLKIEESELPSIKTLGVGWDAPKDMFQFTINGLENFAFSKRGLLSRIATLFDPMQLLAPYVIRAKMTLQEAWLRGLDWDEPFPDDLRERVQKWIEMWPRYGKPDAIASRSRRGRPRCTHLWTHQREHMPPSPT